MSNELEIAKKRAKFMAVENGGLDVDTYQPSQNPRGLFPIDPIPDFIPGVGLLDEMMVVPLDMLIAAKMFRKIFSRTAGRKPARWPKERGR